MVILAIGYLLIVFLYRWYVSSSIDAGSISISLAYGIFVGFAFERIRMFIQTSSDKVFLKGRYDFKDVMGYFVKRLFSVVSLKDLRRVFEDARVEVERNGLILNFFEDGLVKWGKGERGEKKMSKEFINSNEIGEKIDSFPISFRYNNAIKHFFDKNVSDYLTFLSDFKKTILDIKEYSPAQQERINLATLNVVNAGHELERLVSSKQIMIEVKKLFRELIYPWIAESEIMKRALNKPRGYPGDYKMLEYIYDDEPVSSGLGYYFDNGFLKSQLTSAVRERKNKMRGLLKAELIKGPINILNLASGSCREIRELDNDYLIRIKDLTCVDYDFEALSFSKSNLRLENTNFIKEDIIDLIKNNKGDLIEGKDLVYSIGLIDYFPDRLLKKLVSLILMNLRVGSKLILTIKDRDKYNPIQEDWLTDWTFVPRNEIDIRNIISEAYNQNLDIEVSRCGSDIIIFLVITKR